MARAGTAGVDGEMSKRGDYRQLGQEVWPRRQDRSWQGRRAEGEGFCLQMGGLGM